VFKEKLKNVVSHYSSGLPTYLNIRVDCKHFNRGGRYICLASLVALV